MTALSLRRCHQGVRARSDVGTTGGAQAGRDYQFASNWVLGIAGDVSAADFRGIATDPFFGGKNGGPATLSSRTDWTASITGRIGYTLDSVLLYGKGGVAFTHDRYALNNFVAIGGNFCNGNVIFGFDHVTRPRPSIEPDTLLVLY